MNNNVIKKITSLILIGIFAVISFTGCSSKKSVEDLGNEISSAAADALSVASIYSYSGEFVEDGSDESVENIVAAILVNNTSTDYEYVEFSVVTDKATHKFTASTVKAGSVTTVLCKDKDNFENNESMQSFSIDISAEYVTPISLAEGILEIYYTDETVSLKNASDKDFNNISVFYKQKNDLGYFGGITYQSKISSLKAGEITQLNSQHLDEIVNIVYYE